MQPIHGNDSISESPSLSVPIKQDQPEEKIPHRIVLPYVVLQNGQLTLNFKQDPDLLHTDFDSKLYMTTLLHIRSQTGTHLTVTEGQVQTLVGQKKEYYNTEECHQLISFLEQSLNQVNFPDKSLLQAIFEGIGKTSLKNEGIYLTFLLLVGILRENDMPLAFEIYLHLLKICDITSVEQEKNPFLVKLKALFLLRMSRFQEAIHTVEQGFTQPEIAIDWLQDFKILRIEILLKMRSYKLAEQSLMELQGYIQQGIYFRHAYLHLRCMHDYAIGDWDQALKCGTHFFDSVEDVYLTSIEVATCLAKICRAREIPLDNKIILRFLSLFDPLQRGLPGDKYTRFQVGGFFKELLFNNKNSFYNLIAAALKSMSEYHFQGFILDSLQILEGLTVEEKKEIIKIYHSFINAPGQLSADFFYYRTLFNWKVNRKASFADIDEALNLDPLHVDAAKLKAAMFGALKKNCQKVIEILGPFQKLAPDNSSINYCLAKAYEDLKNYPKALEHINAHLKSNSSSQGFLIRANIYHQSQKCNLVEEDYFTVLRDSENNTQLRLLALHALVSLGYLTGLNVEDKVYLEELKNSSSQFHKIISPFYHNFITILSNISEGQFKTALSMLQECLEMDFEKQLCHFHMAFCLLQEGEKEQALKTIKKCIQLSTSNLQHASLVLKMEIFASLENYDAILGEEANLFQKNRSFKLRCQALEVFTKACYELNHLDKALKVCQILLKQAPENPFLLNCQKAIQQDQALQIKVPEAPSLETPKHPPIIAGSASKTAEELPSVRLIKPDESIRQALIQRHQRYATKPLNVGKMQESFRKELRESFIDHFKRLSEHAEANALTNPAPAPSETPKEVTSVVARTPIIPFFGKKDMDRLKISYNSLLELKALLNLQNDPNSRVHELYRQPAFASRLLRYHLFRLCELLKGDKNRKQLEYLVSAHIMDAVTLRRLRNWLSLDGHRIDYKQLQNFCQDLLKQELESRLEFLMKGELQANPTYQPNISILLPKDFTIEWNNLTTKIKKNALLTICKYELEFVKTLQGLSSDHFFEKGKDLQAVLKVSILTVGKSLSRLKKEFGYDFNKSCLQFIENASKRVRHQVIMPKPEDALFEELRVKTLWNFLQESDKYLNEINNLF